MNQEKIVKLSVRVPQWLNNEMKLIAKSQRKSVNSLILSMFDKTANENKDVKQCQI